MMGTVARPQEHNSNDSHHSQPDHQRTIISRDGSKCMTLPTSRKMSQSSANPPSQKQQLVAPSNTKQPQQQQKISPFPQRQQNNPQLLVDNSVSGKKRNKKQKKKNRQNGASSSGSTPPSLSEDEHDMLEQPHPMAVNDQSRNKLNRQQEGVLNGHPDTSQSHLRHQQNPNLSQSPSKPPLNRNDQCLNPELAQLQKPPLNNGAQPANPNKKGKKKKNDLDPDELHPQNGAIHQHHHLPPHNPNGVHHHAQHQHHHHGGALIHHDGIWGSTDPEEREKIRDFWLGLSEEERRGLVKLEKEAVLKKMKEQQKGTCSCWVCGKKRYLLNILFS
ncbi:salt tolerance down-regulator-domain-containing protein [Paraphysoderma sedebokerense]|nr:salt tolerance down-regulator-domain-containing protein [Paraphysoderma sedebokerense]